MYEYEELKEMLKKELKEISKKGELSAGSLDTVDKLTHSLKSIETIMAMDKHSNRSSYNSYDNSYARRGRDGDGDGRYSEDRYSNASYASSYEYSREGNSRDMKRKLEAMLDEPINERTRMAVLECLEKIS